MKKILKKTCAMPDSNEINAGVGKSQIQPMYDLNEIFLQHYSGIILIIDVPEYVIRYINKGGVAIIGNNGNAETIEGTKLTQIVAEDDWILMAMELKKLQEDPSSTATFICRLNVHNSFKHFKVNGNYIDHENDNNSRSIMLMAEDISETVAARKELSETRQLILETEEFLNCGVYNWDYQMNATKWSKGMYDIFNIPFEENESQSLDWFMEFVDEDDVPYVKNAMEQSIRLNKHYEVEYTIHPKNGPPKMVISRGKVISDVDGNLKILGITCDITELKILDRERERMIHDLYRSNLELEEFAYVASHDLHEPLRKISTFSERLQSRFKEELPAEAEIYLRRIIASTGNMRMLIDNLLEFSRVSRYQPERKDVNLTQVLNEVKSELELVIEESGAKIIYGELPTIQGGHTHLKRLFSNLIANAIKFRKKGILPEIEIGFTKLHKAGLEQHNLPSDRAFYTIHVKDNGIGFEEEYAQRIFQIFQRLHGKSEYPGSGMGLAICKKIVENHGGVMYAKSSPHGAVFFIILPEKQ